MIAPHVVLYAGAQSPVPFRADDYPATLAGWTELCDGLEYLAQGVPDCPPSAPPDEQKKRMVAWAPHRIVGPEGTARSVHSAQYVTLMVIDVDRCNIDQVGEELAAYARVGIPSIVYASPSDPGEAEPDDRRVRVVAPLAVAVLSAECRHSRLAFAESLGLGPEAGVAGAQEAAKVFFIGRMHGAPARDVWRFEVAQ